VSRVFLKETFGIEPDIKVRGETKIKLLGKTDDVKDH
jgi:hypothetical protein